VVAELVCFRLLIGEICQKNYLKRFSSIISLSFVTLASLISHEMRWLADSKNYDWLNSLELKLESSLLVSPKYII
jgi:hypothetical protein